MNLVVKPPVQAILRPDLAAIADMVQEGSKVLDIGCGDGTLLEYLVHTKHVDGRGLELSQQNVNQCVARGLSVVQGDADTDLGEYPSGIFDVVILSQTIQATRHPRLVLNELLRIGKHVIVSFPNFGHWRVRLSLLFRGRMPITRTLGHFWYDTPNIHLCTIADFLVLVRQVGGRIERAVALVGTDRTRKIPGNNLGANLLAEGAIFRLTKK
ncbi:MAG TPA: methionine biosynthesis protein MetW [Micropepsaceae bacterium]|nr:methionine biosynthesis protein MetW [Micropepsaceae bacterium]